MGAWGYKFYENDEAADWLPLFSPNRILLPAR